MHHLQKVQLSMLRISLAFVDVESEVVVSSDENDGDHGERVERFSLRGKQNRKQPASQQRKL